MIHNEGTTVMQEAEKAFEHITELQTEIERISQELSERTDYESDDYHRLIDKLTHDNELLQIVGSGNFYAEIEKPYWDLVSCEPISTVNVPNLVAGGVCASN